MVPSDTFRRHFVPFTICSSIETTNALDSTSHPSPTNPWPCKGFRLPDMSHMSHASGALVLCYDRIVHIDYASRIAEDISRGLWNLQDLAFPDQRYVPWHSAPKPTFGTIRTTVLLLTSHLPATFKIPRTVGASASTRVSTFSLQFDAAKPKNPHLSATVEFASQCSSCLSIASTSQSLRAQRATLVQAA